MCGVHGGAWVCGGGGVRVWEWLIGRCGGVDTIASSVLENMVEASPHFCTISLICAASFLSPHKMRACGSMLASKYLFWCAQFAKIM